MSTTIEDRTWKARIRVLLVHEGTPYDDITIYTGSGTECEVELIQNVTMGESSPRDIGQTLNEWNAYTVPRPHVFSFSFEVPMNLEVAVLLKYIQRDNKYFDLELEENQDQLPDDLDGIQQFKPGRELLGHAFIEDATQTFDGVSIPRLRVSGRALRAAVGDSQVQYGQYPFFVS